MGTFKVEAEVWNPKRPKARERVELLVDTGATYTTMPSTALGALEVEPFRTVKLRLADGRVIEKPLGEVGIEIEGYRASATPVVFGDEGIFLLGSVTMEQLGLVPDPVSKRLRPTEALLMELPMSRHVKERANALSRFTSLRRAYW
jgi:predicted aspartyl protease